MSKKNKIKHVPFVMVTKEVLDAPAWRAMSHGARSLYIALKRRYNQNFQNNGRLFLSQRQARQEIGSSPNQIARWFRENQYYGFIVMVRPGCLGVEGKGKAPHWRLTEVGYMNDPPTRDFERWDRIRFSRHETGGDRSKPKTESRYGKGVHTVTENGDTPVTENRNASRNKRYGKRVHTAAPTVTEKGDIINIPLGRPSEAGQGGMAGPAIAKPRMSDWTLRANENENHHSRRTRLCRD
jgi:hypothetical protein